MSIEKKIYLGADHGGFHVKEYAKKLLKKLGYKVEDVGTYNTDSVDYPDYISKVAKNVSKEKNSSGVVACSTGIGASIVANKVRGIRAALVHNKREARLSREHNDSNVLVLGGKPYNQNNVKDIINTWIKTGFQGGRHLRRIKKIDSLEQHR
ncbi:MAG: ribose 5-phosphate isomerase B [bacterium]